MGILADCVYILLFSGLVCIKLHLKQAIGSHQLVHMDIVKETFKHFNSLRHTSGLYYVEHHYLLCWVGLEVVQMVGNLWLEHGGI